MPDKHMVERFARTAQKVGASLFEARSIDDAVHYIREHLKGPALLPEFPCSKRFDLGSRLAAAGVELLESRRELAAAADAGITGANFALADTGTLVLESTAEAVRLATTLPQRHFALLDPRKILPDGLAAVPHLREFHRRDVRNYLAFISGPSRTADIERVLTIGVHGPKELHILLLPGLSDDPYEM